MIPEPLHPAVVHLPIVLMLLLPMIALLALVAIRRGVEARRAWIPVVVLAGGVVASAWFAVETGEAEEDIVESVVSEAAIHEHEEAAEIFVFGSLGTLLILGVGLMDNRTGRAGRVAGTVAAILLTLAGYQVGRLGGALVYEHGAAAAYLSTDASSTQTDRAPNGNEEPGH